MPETQTTPTASPAVPPASAAPVPLTAVPGDSTVATEEPKAKRKYTKRAAKWAKKDAAPKKTKRTMKTKTEKKAKPEKKARRVAGTKAQGQIPKSAMKFAKATAKERDITVGVLVGTGVVKYLKSLGYDPEA